jgi:hypothetical protein
MDNVRRALLHLDGANSLLLVSLRTVGKSVVLSFFMPLLLSSLLRRNTKVVFLRQRKRRVEIAVSMQYA